MPLEAYELRRMPCLVKRGADLSGPPHLNVPSPRGSGTAALPLEAPGELRHQHARAQRNLRLDELTGRDVGRAVLVGEVAARELHGPVVLGNTNRCIVGSVAGDRIATQSGRGLWRAEMRRRRVLFARKARRLVALRPNVARTDPDEGVVVGEMPVVPRPGVEHPGRRPGRPGAVYTVGIGVSGLLDHRDAVAERRGVAGARAIARQAGGVGLLGAV